MVDCKVLRNVEWRGSERLGNLCLPTRLALWLYADCSHVDGVYPDAAALAPQGGSKVCR